MKINDSGQVVGATYDAGIVRVFTGDSNGTITLPAVSGCVSTLAPSINDHGQIVGSGCGGWIWDESNGTRLLNDLVPSGWQIGEVGGINNNGQIAAYATNSLGFSGRVILDPTLGPGPDLPPVPAGTPEPRTWVVVVSGFIVLLVCNRPVFYRTRFIAH